jgi:hypothetical protein
MSSSNLVNFEPKWAREGLRRISAPDDMPNLGFPPILAPRLPTRIVPKNNTNQISVITLVETVSATQRLLYYAGYETVHGVRLDFADLRQIDSQISVSQISKLNVEPFEEGSFIIPASLSEEEEIEVTKDGEKITFRAQDVLQRFVDILEGVSTGRPDFPVCIGALQVIEDLGKVLNREANILEYSPAGFSRSPSERKNLVVDRILVDFAAASRKYRLSPQSISDLLEGQLTAVDIIRGSLKLKLPNRDSISGTFTDQIQDHIIRYLGRQIRLSGIVEYKQKKPTSIRANDVELIED